MDEEKGGKWFEYGRYNLISASISKKGAAEVVHSLLRAMQVF